MSDRTWTEALTAGRLAALEQGRFVSVGLDVLESRSVIDVTLRVEDERFPIEGFVETSGGVRLFDGEATAVLSPEEAAGCVRWRKQR